MMIILIIFNILFFDTTIKLAIGRGTAATVVFPLSGRSSFNSSIPKLGTVRSLEDMDLSNFQSLNLKYLVTHLIAQRIASEK